MPSEVGGSIGDAWPRFLLPGVHLTKGYGEVAAMKSRGQRGPGLSQVGRQARQCMKRKADVRAADLAPIIASGGNLGFFQ
jgi:hypothetical protein